MASSPFDSTIPRARDALMTAYPVMWPTEFPSHRCQSPPLASRQSTGGVTMRREDLFKLPSMPAAGPSYPAGPYRFVNREFLVITYETDPELIRAGLQETLEPIEQPIVSYTWLKMYVSSGFGRCIDSGIETSAG